MCRFFLSLQSPLLHFCFLLLCCQSPTQEPDRLRHWCPQVDVWEESVSVPSSGFYHPPVSASEHAVQPLSISFAEMNNTAIAGDHDICYFPLDQYIYCGLIWRENVQPQCTFQPRSVAEFGLSLQGNSWNHSYSWNLLLKATYDSTVSSSVRCVIYTQYIQWLFLLTKGQQPMARACLAAHCKQGTLSTYWDPYCSMSL